MQLLKVMSRLVGRSGAASGICARCALGVRAAVMIRGWVLGLRWNEHVMVEGIETRIQSAINPLEYRDGNFGVCGFGGGRLPRHHTQKHAC
ncbi:hypothetical protein AX14_012987 [Amanita brunnescens Koide BX004]|nr:hypothetical protein AX14_012987 [Amanita brunnescens Koide BX004]